jgi:EAL domain-containing protein (putative c-di-GMP-specific phosphodiesterase class I)
VLWFQPEVDLISRKVERVEALLRWQHPEKGLLLPGDFLPDIEGTELEVAVDEWVVDAAIRQHLDWFRQGRPLHMSINIGANHLLRPDFFARLMQRFSDIHGSQVKGFELEILETAALSDFEQAMLVVSDCRAAGLKIALDDFGTGYSSLAYLRRLPVDRIKIDQAFVRDMLEDSGDMEIVESIIRLAASLGRAVIAEGVETLDHAALLAWLGCRHGQGYGIARPMPATDLPAWMQQWSAQRGWPEAEPEHADQHPELPILVAAQNHRYWLHRFDAATAMADFDRLEEFAGARCPFTSWHEGAGKEHFGKLSEFEAAGQAHYRLHRLAEALAAQQRADPDRAPHPESLHQIRRASGDLLRALQGLVKRVRSSGPTDGE